MDNEYVDQFFTLEDLRMIRAMVLTACPWAGEDASQMPESFAKVYRTAENKIKNVTQSQKALPYSDVPMYEPWASLYAKADSQLSALTT